MNLLVMNEPGTDFLSIVIVSYNARDHLRRCLRSLRDHPPAIRHEIIVVDNQSPDASDAMVAQEFPEVHLIRSESNDGYGVAINRGVRDSTGNLFLFLNPDMEVFAGSCDTLLNFLDAHPRAGVVGPRLVYGDGTPQGSVGRRSSPLFMLLESSRLHLLLSRRLRGRLLQGPYLPMPETMRVDWISGACHLIPRAVWEKVGPLTEETFCGFDDYDYCFRTWKAGYEVWVCAESVMIHNTSTSVRKRWASWEVERLAAHNTYVILNSHWPRWRVRMIAACELFGHLTELLRTTLRPRSGDHAIGEPYAARVRKRLRLTWGLMTGSTEPIRRFQPRRRADVDDAVGAGCENPSVEKAG
jgi:N-acetylglucosaminyl-diphospho-decaprenol L-rhamnosyltransferase